jgi:hypothetical protein
MLRRFHSNIQKNSAQLRNNKKKKTLTHSFTRGFGLSMTFLPTITPDTWELPVQRFRSWILVASFT